MRMIRICKSVLLLSLLILLFCRVLPTNPDNPENVSCTIQLMSQYNGTNDTLIDDSLDGTVSVELRYKYPRYIDSITLTLLPAALNLTSTLKADTTASLTDFSDKTNDTSIINLRLKTEGTNKVLVACYVNNGTIINDSAVIIVHQRTSASINQAPTVEDDLYSTVEGTLLTVVKTDGVLSNDTDPENDIMTAAIKDTFSTVKGIISFSSNGSFVFTPAANVNGIVSFTYVAIDNKGNTSIPATVTIVVRPVNNSPAITGTSVLNINEGATITRKIIATDPDSTTPRISITDATTPDWITYTDSIPGTLVLIAAPPHSVIATGTTGSTASFTIHFTASDDSVTVYDSMQIIVRDVNQKPAVSITSLRAVDTVLAGSTLPVTVAASDSDGTVLHVKLYQNGTVLNTDFTAPYTFPTAALAYGVYRFVAVATDNCGDTTKSAECVVKVCKWDNLQRTAAGINHSTFDRNGDAIYSQYDSSIHTLTISRFNTTGVWQVAATKTLATAEQPLFGTMTGIQVAFMPDNEPVVVFYHMSPEDSAPYYRHKFVVASRNAAGTWTKICDTIDTVQAMRTFLPQLEVSSTGAVTLCLNASTPGGTSAGPIYIQNGTASAWIKYGQPVSGKPVTLFYDQSILYASSHNFGYGYITSLHRLDGSTWMPVGSSDGSIVYATYQDRMSFTSTGIPYIATRASKNSIYTLNKSSSWQMVWPVDTTADSLSTDFYIKVINDQLHATFLKHNSTNNVDSIYCKRLTGSTMTGLFSSSGLVLTASGYVNGSAQLQHSFANKTQHLITWRSYSTASSTSNYHNIAWAVIPE